MVGTQVLRELFAIIVDGQTIARFATLVAATTPGLPPRPLQPHEVGLLATAPTASAPRHFHGVVNRFSSGARGLVLRRGIGDGLALHRWNSGATPRDAILATLGTGRAPLARYHLTNAWPQKWSGPPAVKPGDVAIEEVVIAYESLRRG